MVEYARLIEQGERNLNFLFDICGWQVEEGDGGVILEALAKHHLFFLKVKYTSFKVCLRDLNLGLAGDT